MGIKAIVDLLKTRQLFLLFKLSKFLTPFYRLSYISSLFTNGYLQLLAEKPMTFEELAEKQGIDKNNADALKAWLQTGIRINELALSGGKYSLKGLSARLSRQDNDALFAIVQEIVSLHHKLILDTPAKIKKGELWTLDDQDGDVIARSSRIAEPFQKEVISKEFPDAGSARLLEIGCGSGIYIRYAAAKNPDLTAVGVELQASVAEMARQNMDKWNLQDRVQIESGDIRSKKYDSEFDIVTLYNNIYYFPVSERVDLLKHLLGFLKPGGKLVLTTACQGGQPLTELLNLWGASTEGCGRLPGKDEMISQMQEAGFTGVKSKNL
ncbi:MAG: methyltransferase domain-containing protein, partial [Chlorobi bacterium]|nr:methyltransferase domain-containing protein [Chlorobiota bacterium]